MALEKHFDNPEPDPGIYEALNEIGCPCVTTNYDELLAPQYTEKVGASIASTAVNRVFDVEDLSSTHLDRPGTVVHLHGAVSDPKNMIVTTRNYLEHYDEPKVKVFLGELFARKTVLFVGYGLDESEILEHILRRGDTGLTRDRRRFALQGFFGSQLPMYESLHRYYERSFGVHLLGFLRDHTDYSCLARILADWSRKLVVKKTPLAAEAAYIDEVLGGD